MIEHIEPAPRCAAQHFGYWCVNTDWLNEAVASYRSGVFIAKRDEEGRISSSRAGRVVIVPIDGHMTKGESSMGGTSTVSARRDIRAAVNDPDVRGIMLHISSPGGTVSGAYELADDIAAAASRKPVHSFIADMGASAAYLAASQTRRISANRTAMIGSLGTFARLVDESGALDKAGIKVHVISSGGAKGAGADGRVTDELIAEAQQQINDMNEHFIAAVRSGRGFTEERTRELFDGRVHIADKAKGLGLIDEVSSFDEAMTQLSQEIHNMDSPQFAAYAAEHPEELAVAASVIVKDAQAKSHADGVAEERDRASRIAAIAPDAATARKHISAGSSPAAVKDELFEVQAKELADLKAKAAANPGQAGVAFTPPKETAAEPDAKADPKARAEWEYDNGKAVYQSISRESYVSGRAWELKKAAKAA